VKVAVVTGGSSGIGAATARLLAARGWHCVLLARGLERLERVAAEIGAEALACDVGDLAQVEEAAGRIGERHPALQLLVSSAGIPGRKGFLELDPARIEEVLRTNYLGGVWCLRAFLPLLRAGAPSDVVNVVSTAGTIAVPRSGPYSASKHAQLAFSRSVAVELAPLGIRLHTINPGPVRTEGFPQERLLKGGWTSRWVLRPEEVADAIVAAVDKGTREVHLPRSFRLLGIAQALVPGTLTAMLGRRRVT
jgi:uncharacterized protein